MSSLLKLLLLSFITLLLASYLIAIELLISLTQSPFHQFDKNVNFYVPGDINHSRLGGR